MLQSCGGSVPGNYKLVTDLASDLNTRHRANSQELLPGGLGISMRIKQKSAERWEPGMAGNGKLGNLCGCVFILMFQRCSSLCFGVLKTPFVSD